MFVFFLAILGGMIANLADFKHSDFDDFSQIKEFSKRKKLFKDIYYQKLGIGTDVNRVIWSAVQKQRDDPPEEPLIFLLFSQHVTKMQLRFAQHLGAVARRQEVNFLTPNQVTSKHGFLDLLRSSFRKKK